MQTNIQLDSNLQPSDRSGDSPDSSYMSKAAPEAQQHRLKMQRRKEVQAQRLAERSLEKGLIIVHTGNGKGKTTAALGMVLRSLGHGYRVAIEQFI